MGSSTGRNNMGLDFSSEGTPEDGVPDFASGGVAVAAPDFSKGGEELSFGKVVMTPQEDVMPRSTLLEPWRYVPAASREKTGVGAIDQERVRQVNAHFDGLKDLAGDNQPEKAAAIESARADALRAEGVGVVSSELKARLPRVPQASSVPGQIGAGLVNAGEGLVEGILDPKVIGAALTMPARAVAAFFAVDTAAHVPDLVRQTYKAVAAKDWQKASELAATTAVSGWLTKKLGEHAAGPGTKAHQFAEALAREEVTGGTKVGGLEVPAVMEGAPDFSRAGVQVQTFDSGAADVSVAPGETITGRVSDEGKASVMPAEPAVAVTPGVIPETVRSAGPQVLDFSEEGSPAVETAATPRRRVATVDRPWDILDELEASVGKIRGKASARPGTEGYYGETYEAVRKVGAARAMFSNERGVSPDDAADALRRSGHLPEGASVDDLWDAMDAAAKARKGFRANLAAEARAGKEEESQQRDFTRQALKPGPEKDAISVGDLLEGDELTIAGAKFKVKELGFDPDTTDLTHVVLEDGRRFGVKSVGADQVIHADKGSLKQVERPTEFVPAEEEEAVAVEADPAKRQEILNSVLEGEAILKHGRTIAGRKMTEAELGAVRRAVEKSKARLGPAASGPEFVPAEGGGEQGTMGLGVEAKTAEQLAAEKAAAEQRARIQELQHKRLIGGEVDSTMDMLDETKAANPLFARRPRGGGGGGGSQGDPMDRGPVQASPVQGAPYPPGTPTSTLFNARVPVAMAKMTNKTVTIPEIMRSLENIIRVTGGETPIPGGEVWRRRARGVQGFSGGGAAEVGG
jgi:hypothetical protein